MAKLNDPACTEVNLTSDIIDYAGTCINNPVNFNNKIFDCQGHVIDGNLTSNSYGIYLSSHANNTIRNCTVTEFYYGIYLSSAKDNNFININLLSNTFGVMGYGATGNFTNVYINNSDYGLYFSSSSNMIIRDGKIEKINKKDITSLQYSNITLINVTFNESNVNINTGGIIYVKWYLDAYVKNRINNSPIENAKVEIINHAGTNNETILSTLFTNSSGFIARQILLEYFQDQNGKYYDTPIKVKASANSYTDEYDITSLVTNNVTDDNTHIVLKLSPISGYGGGRSGGASGEELFVVNINADNLFDIESKNPIIIETYSYALNKIKVDSINFTIVTNDTDTNLSEFLVIEEDYYNYFSEDGYYKYYIWLNSTNETFLNKKFELVVSASKSGKVVNGSVDFVIVKKTETKKFYDRLKENFTEDPFKWFLIVLIVLMVLLFVIMALLIGRKSINKNV
jgi:parallel beta-helix repeat protein